MSQDGAPSQKAKSHVAPPPSAGKNVVPPPSGDLSPDPPAIPTAKPAKGEYRRFLPHLQVEGRPLFVTFVTHNRWVLPESVRDLILKHCLHDHEIKYYLHGVIVMPDHVHMIFTALNDNEGMPFGLAEIMNGIKGSSAHTINKVLRRRGHVWQREFFDHVLRSEESIHSKVQYICENPIRKGLGSNIEDYPWLWREWAEGEANGAPPLPAAHK